MDKNNVTHKNKSDTIFNMRIPTYLKEEIKRQANDLNMSASSLAKVILSQAFLKK